MSVLDRVRRDPVFRNSLAIMGSTVVTSGLGYVFWFVLARTADATTSGEAAAFASAVQLVALVASVGAAAALVEWLPKADGDRTWRQYVTLGWLVAVVTSGVAALLVVALTIAGVVHLPQVSTLWGSTGFVLACVAFGVGTVVDYVCVVRSAGVTLLVRNTLLTGLRIPLYLLGLAVVAAEVSVVWAWTGAALLATAWAVASFHRRVQSLTPDTRRLALHAGQMRRSFAGQHLITVTAMTAGYLLPLLVVSRLSAQENAWFYITWMLGSIFFIISPAVSTAVFAESASTPERTAALARRSLVLVLGLLAVPIAVYLVGGSWLLSWFGEDYREAGAVLLVVLTLSAVPDAVTNVAVAILRATGRLGAALWLNTAMLVVVVAGAWVTMPRWGIVAVGWSWFAAQALGALWVLCAWRWITRGGEGSAS